MKKTSELTKCKIKTEEEKTLTYCIYFYFLVYIYEKTQKVPERSLRRDRARQKKRLKSEMEYKKKTCEANRETMEGDNKNTQRPIRNRNTYNAKHETNTENMYGIYAR